MENEYIKEKIERKPRWLLEVGNLQGWMGGGGGVLKYWKYYRVYERELKGKRLIEID